MAAGVRMETNRKPKFDANIIYLNEKLFERLQKFKVGDIISAGANVPTWEL